ncbi:MAG: 30S ribosomal protein S12 methylthiotransferase RimO [Candidatus Omnitrophica bacterium]|nr:30S ribosomal protein S12 methylthiotransferase RimO [Candidatus Omnitrophota bacterium]
MAKEAEKLSAQIISEQIGSNNKISLVNFGCARNLVDSQIILGELTKNKNKIVDISKAEVVIINTCGFIESAKKESLDAIVELVDLKKEGKLKKIIVAGCLSERYKEVIEKEFKEVDVIVGVQKLQKDKVLKQVRLTPKHFAYLKICESCYNKCSFCAIPGIKGEFRSRSIRSIVEEVKQLDKEKVRELNIIGQDITAYGIDIYKKKSLAKLLKAILKETKNIKWIRLLYMFPTHITDDLLDIIACEDKICKYMDIPFQHISSKVLKKMNRNITKKQTMALISNIREKIPQVKLRTSFIVGFPQETNDEFEELVDFVKDQRFDKVGVFKYSHEEDTPAYKLSGQISKKVKDARFDKLMGAQLEVSKDIQEKFIGRELMILIDEPHSEDKGVYVGRSEYDAPEVDGVVYVHSTKKLKVGDLVKVRITDAYDYDLLGDLV